MELKSDISRLELKLANLEWRVLKWLIAVLVVVVQPAIVFGFLYFLQSHSR